jgi:hypothetical protein
MLTTSDKEISERLVPMFRRRCRMKETATAVSMGFFRHLWLEKRVDSVVGHCNCEVKKLFPACPNPVTFARCSASEALSMDKTANAD